MKNKQIDDLIQPAMEFVEQNELEKNGVVAKEYESALASFGAAIIQSGPLPACALYLKSSESKIDRSKLVFILMRLVQKQGGFESKEIDNERKELMKQVIDESRVGEELFKHYLINAAIALKLALRTFNLKKIES